MGKEKFCLCHELHFLIFTGFQDILDLSVKNTLSWAVKSEGGNIPLRHSDVFSPAECCGLSQGEIPFVWACGVWLTGQGGQSSALSWEQAPPALKAQRMDSGLREEKGAIK